MINRLTVLSCVKNKLDTGKVSSVKIKRADNISFVFIHVSLTLIFLASSIGGGLTK